MILTLDTNALDKLFADPQARVMLRQAVIAELAKRVMPKNTSPDPQARVMLRQAVIAELAKRVMPKNTSPASRCTRSGGASKTP